MLSKRSWDNFIFNVIIPNVMVMVTTEGCFTTCIQSGNRDQHGIIIIICLYFHHIVIHNIKTETEQKRAIPKPRPRHRS